MLFSVCYPALAEKLEIIAEPIVTGSKGPPSLPIFPIMVHPMCSSSRCSLAQTLSSPVPGPLCIPLMGVLGSSAQRGIATPVITHGGLSHAWNHGTGIEGRGQEC